MKICQKCNSQYEDNINFCIKCGTQLSEGIKIEHPTPVQQATENKKNNYIGFAKFFAVILVCVLGYFAFAGNGFLKNDLDKGKENLKQERYQQAFEIFDKYAIENPNSIDAVIGRAKACVELNRLKEAKRDINRAFELKKDSSDAFVAQGMYYAKIANQLNEEYSIYTFKKFNKMDVDEVARTKLLYAMTDNQLDAYLMFSRAIQLNPENLDAYVERAELFAKLSIPFFGEDKEKVKKVNSEIDSNVIFNDLRFVIKKDKDYYKAYFYKAKMLGEFFRPSKDSSEEAIAAIDIYTKNCGNTPESTKLKESILQRMNL